MEVELTVAVVNGQTFGWDVHCLDGLGRTWRLTVPRFYVPEAPPEGARIKLRQETATDMTCTLNDRQIIITGYEPPAAL